MSGGGGETERASESGPRFACAGAMPFDEARLGRVTPDSAVDDAIVTIPPGGRVNSRNEGAERIPGWGEHEIVGRPAVLFFTDEDDDCDRIGTEMRLARGKARRRRALPRARGRLALPRAGTDDAASRTRRRGRERAADDPEPGAEGRGAHASEPVRPAHRNDLRRDRAAAGRGAGRRGDRVRRPAARSRRPGGDERARFRGARRRRAVAAPCARPQRRARAGDGAPGRAQGMPVGRPGGQVDIHAAIADAMAPQQGEAERVTMEGRRVTLSARQVLGLGLAVHELGRDADKFGALSSGSGRVSVRWTMDDAWSGKRRTAPRPPWMRPRAASAPPSSITSWDATSRTAPPSRSSPMAPGSRSRVASIFRVLDSGPATANVGLFDRRN